jgi:septum formation protein
MLQIIAIQNKYIMKLILGSSSESRIKLLEKIGYKPDLIIHPEIDEIQLKGELPHKTAMRLAIAKAQKISQIYPHDLVISADTVCAKGRLQLPKTMLEDQVRFCLNKLSGCRHKTYTGVCGISNGKIISKLGTTVIKFKVLSQDDIEEFIVDKKQWYGKAGGYTLAGIASGFITMIRGDDTSSVMGLPLYYTRNFIKTLGSNQIKKYYE